MSNEQLVGLARAKAQRLKRRRKVSGLLEWTMRRRRWIDPKTLFDLPNHLYLIDIYDETNQEVVVKKPAQVGISEWCISYTLHAGDERGMDVVYVMPTAGDVSDFSQSRFGPALEASPYLNSIVVAGGQQEKRGSDKVTLKRIRDSFLYFRGGQVGVDGSARQLKSIPADALVLDELDEMDPRAPEIARKRLGHSEIGEVRAVSTPTYPNVGIDALWQGSDQRRWFIQCEWCGRRQFLGIQHVVLAWDELGRPVRWNGQEEGRAFVACEQCGRELNRLARGEWVAEFPERAVAGYHLTKLISPRLELLKVVQNLSSLNETKRREAFNQDLGEVYMPKGGQLTDAILDECRREYGHGPRVGEVRPAMGVDVGKILHGVIRMAVEGGWEQLWAGEIDSFGELGNIMRRFQVGKVVIDGLPETRQARKFQSEWPEGVVWLAYYSEDSKQDNPVRWDTENGVVMVDRTRSLDETFSRFYEQRNRLPANAREIPDYYNHLKAPVRVLEERRGGDKVARYIESGPDHLAHAENYCTAALQAPRVRAAVAVSRAVKE